MLVVSAVAATLLFEMDRLVVAGAVALPVVVVVDVGSVPVVDFVVVVSGVVVVVSGVVVVVSGIVVVVDVLFAPSSVTENEEVVIILERTCSCHFSTQENTIFTVFNQK